MARPAYKPTAAARRKVSIAAGAGMSHEDIALSLGITRPTLSKHFESELSIGANAKRLEVLVAMFAAAKKGNVAAQKAYMSTVPAIAAPPAQPDAAGTTPAKPARTGKKEQANIDAQQAGAGTGWDALLNPTARH